MEVLDLVGWIERSVQSSQPERYAQNGLRSATNQKVPNPNASDPFAPFVYLALPSLNYRYLEPTLVSSLA